MVFKKYESPKTLRDHYPLSQEDCSKLQVHSGRNFNLNAMNEILLNVASKCFDRFFNSKQAFMSYMTKIYSNEMRDAEKINNVNFKIKANQTPEEKQEEQTEKYLSEIENSSQVTPEWNLKKKLTNVLARPKSYALLKSFKTVAIEGGVAKLILRHPVDLTDHDISIILSQIKATHEHFERGEYHQIDQVEIIAHNPKPVSSLQGQAKSQDTKLPDNLWGAMRQKLISRYCQAIDGHWFAKLEARIDEDKKIIELKAKDKFYENWIRTHYLQTMEEFAKAMGLIIRFTV